MNPDFLTVNKGPMSSMRQHRYAMGKRDIHGELFFIGVSVSFQLTEADSPPTPQYIPAAELE